MAALDSRTQTDVNVARGQSAVGGLYLRRNSDQISSGTFNTDKHLVDHLKAFDSSLAQKLTLDRFMKLPI